MLEGTAVFVVPELLFYEMANALRYNPNLSAKDVNEASTQYSMWGLK